MTLALLDTVERYATPQRKTSKEHCSPCPFCGGNDRFIILPYESSHKGKDMPPHAFCRQCQWWGTAEMLLQQKEHISYADAKAIIDGSKTISEVSTGTHRPAGRTKKTTPASVEGAPCVEWQSLLAFCKVAKAALWSEAGAKALQWLRGRGLLDELIDSHQFGYNPRDWYMERPEELGLARGEKLWLPRGIVIPYLGQDQLWKIEIRRATNQKKDRYWNVKGSANTLYNYASLEFRGKAVVCEGVFDAVIMKQAMQEAGASGTAVVATGSTNGSYEDRWIMKLSLCDSVAFAFDADDGGNKAFQWWQSRISNAKRWVPSNGDVNEMYVQDKAGLIDAIACGFVLRDPCKVCDKASTAMDIYERQWCAEHFPKPVERFEGLEEYCYECGDDLDSYDVYGRAWCAVHKPVEMQVTWPVVNEPVEPIQDIPAPEKEAVEWPVIEPVHEVIAEPVIVPAKSSQRKEKAKTASMCNTDGCYGLIQCHDMAGGQWCSNCQLRQRFVDDMFAIGFPRIEYSPTHFVEAGESQCTIFAKSMSMTAVSLACREVNRLALVAQ